MKREDALEAAELLICGDRQKAYGDARENHQRIADVWAVILGHEVTAEQVVLCMAGLKLARLAHDVTHRDSAVDGIGYLALLAEMAVKS